MPEVSVKTRIPGNLALTRTPKSPVALLVQLFGGEVSANPHAPPTLEVANLGRYPIGLDVDGTQPRDRLRKPEHRARGIANDRYGHFRRHVPELAHAHELGSAWHAVEARFAHLVRPGESMDVEEDDLGALEGLAGVGVGDTGDEHRRPAVLRA
jgi:hypothetical protein